MEIHNNYDKILLYGKSFKSVKLKKMTLIQTKKVFFSNFNRLENFHDTFLAKNE